MLLVNFHGSISNMREHSSKLEALLTERACFITSLSRSVRQEITRLLVVVSSSLTTEEHNLLGPFLWNHCLHDASSSLAMSVRMLYVATGLLLTSWLGHVSDLAICGKSSQVPHGRNPRRLTKVCSYLIQYAPRVHSLLPATMNASRSLLFIGSTL